MKRAIALFYFAALCAASIPVLNEFPELREWRWKLSNCGYALAMGCIALGLAAACRQFSKHH